MVGYNETSNHDVFEGRVRKLSDGLLGLGIIKALVDKYVSEEVVVYYAGNKEDLKSANVDERQSG